MQGLEALGAAVLGGELENIGHVALLVGLDIAGGDDIHKVIRGSAAAAPAQNQPHGLFIYKEISEVLMYLRHCLS